MSRRHFALTTALLLVAAPVLAHPGHAGASFWSGIGHPPSGLDHVLAMFALGLIAARQEGRLRWLLPLTFILAMVAGAGLSAAGVTPPGIEAGIAASVVGLGLLAALLARLGAAAAVPLVALCAVLHGHAHHAEMGAGSAVAYTAGFVLATASLHALGYAFACALPEHCAAVWVKKAVGAAIAAVGVLLLAT